MPDQELRLEDCYFIREGEIVTLGNSRIERAWTVSSGTLKTIRLVDKLTGRDWSGQHTLESVLTVDRGPGVLGVYPCESVEAEVIETPVSEPCLRVRFALKGTHLDAWKYFDLFPGIPAIRAWLELRAHEDMSGLDYTRVEALSLDLTDSSGTDRPSIRPSQNRDYSGLGGIKVTAVELHDLTDATNHLATVREADLSEPRRLHGNNVFVDLASK